MNTLQLLKEHAPILTTLLCMVIAPFIGITDFFEVTPFIFWEIRIPRMLNGALVGATLATVGCAFQLLFSNPLATPSTTGTTAGASFGALIAILFLPSQGWLGASLLPLFAFLGAILISIPIAWASQQPRISMNDILLAGIACTLAVGALTTGLQFSADMSETYRAVQWSLGSLSNVGYSSTLLLLPPSLLGTLGILKYSRELTALISGEELAWTQGIDIHKVRKNTLLFAAIGIGGCVAQCGPIAFVGLLVPHLLRLYYGSSGQRILWLSPICGAGFLVSCDSIARIGFWGGEVPVGVLTAALGAPMLIGLIWTQRSKP